MGRKATFLDRGRSEAGLSPGWQAADFFALTNGGGYGIRTIKYEMAAAPAEPGPQITDYLNMFEVARSRRGFGSTWAPNSPTCVTLGVAAFDGMLTRLGHVTDEATMTNRGSLGHDVDVEEAKNLLKMTDRELRQWSEDHPFITEYNEFMLTLIDGSYHGHLGFTYSGALGGAAATATMVDQFMKLDRICYCCMLQAPAPVAGPRVQQARLRRRPGGLRRARGDARGRAAPEAQAPRHPAAEPRRLRRRPRGTRIFDPTSM